MYHAAFMTCTAVASLDMHRDTHGLRNPAESSGNRAVAVPHMYPIGVACVCLCVWACGWVDG